MVTGEHDARGVVDEHDVPGRVARGRHHLERPITHHDPVTVREPPVGFIPDQRLLVDPVEDLTEPPRQPLVPAPPCECDHPVAALAVLAQHPQGGLLPDAQCDVDTELAAQRQRLAEVVPVDVGDEEAHDVGEVVAERGESRDERVA